MRLLVLECGLEHRPVPGLRALAHLRDGHLLVAARHALDVVLGRRRRGRSRLRGLPGRGRLLRAAERDLDPGRGGPEAVVPLVAGAPLVLADPDLRAALVRDHGRGDRAVAEQDVRFERRPLGGADAVHDEGLALANAVLLPTETDDRVVHSGETAGAGPRALASVAASARARPTPTRSSGCSPSRRSWTPPQERAPGRPPPVPRPRRRSRSPRPRPRAASGGS